MKRFWENAGRAWRCFGHGFIWAAEKCGVYALACDKRAALASLAQKLRDAAADRDIT